MEITYNRLISSTLIVIQLAIMRNRLVQGAPGLSTDNFVSSCPFVVDPLASYVSYTETFSPSSPNSAPPSPKPPVVGATFSPPSPSHPRPSPPSPFQFPPTPSKILSKIPPPSSRSPPPNPLSKQPPPVSQKQNVPPPQPTNNPFPPTGGCFSTSASTMCGGILSGFKFQASVNFPGNEISSTATATAAASCATTCRTLTGCLGFSQNMTSGICFFKKALSAAQSFPTFESWTQCSTTSTTSFSSSPPPLTKKIPPPPTKKPPPSPTKKPPPPSKTPPPRKAPSPQASTQSSSLCGAKVAGYIFKPYTWQSGFDTLGSLGPNVTPASCATKCSSMAACVGFTHVLSTQTCQFKTSVATQTGSSTMDLYTKCQSGTTKRRLLQATVTDSGLLWSSPATWPGGVVPGVGLAVGANATIPCGTTVILDVANVTLGLLRIRGLLRFKDDPSLPLITVKSNFVLVEGQLFIGSPTQQFRQKAVIELTPNTQNNRASLMYTYTLADPANPRNMGHKAFVVVGGQVHLHGLPGPASMPVWVRLSKTAKDEETTIQVDADVAGLWPVGGQIAVASTDYNRKQTETFTITNVTSTGNGESVISLDKPLAYMHYGQKDSLSDGFGGFVDERAEVALLSRNIVITGTDEPAPYNLEGGHFMVFMTQSPPQFIEGVEFYKMGQQGTLGRYSIHFHIMGNAPQTVCRKNSINASKQRCVVIHASHNITVESNVAFNTSGHCFITEEGGEMDNNFNGNLGMLTNAVENLIMTAGTNPPTSDETDDKPATFWNSNPQNNFRGNVAAGSADSGFWFELRFAVRGNTLSIPTLNSTIPINGNLGVFEGNVAHSNGFSGIRTYPNGMHPRVTWGVDGKAGTFEGITSYKNVQLGMFVHNTDLLTINNGTFADNGWGIFLHQNQRVTVSNSRMVSLTENYGNPEQCWSSSLWAPCKPASVGVCTMPLKWGTQGRSTGGVNRLAPTYGIVVDQSRSSDGMYGSPGNNIQTTSFHKYDPTCSTAAAIVTIGTADLWNPSHNVQGLKFAGKSQPVWLPPQISQVNLWNSLSDAGEQAQFYTLYDKDGSIMGSRGFIVANTTQILPTGLANCSAQPQWNAFSCTGVCYRTIMVAYPEPGFKEASTNVNNVRGDFSHLKVTRVSDGQVLLLDGNLQKTDFPSPVQRYYFATLLANQVYQVEVMPSPRDPGFLPVNMTVKFGEPGECGQGLTLQFRQMANRPWSIPPSDSVFFKQCPGVAPVNASDGVAQHGPACMNQQPWLELVMSPSFKKSITLFRGVSTDGGLCPTTFSCSGLWSGGNWLYDDSGLERRPQFFNPVLSYPANWKQGIAPIGYSSWGSGFIQTPMAQPSTTRLTYYFRKSFNIINNDCYTSLNIDVIVEDGLVLYLNNKEVFRTNLPNGTLSNATTALSMQSFGNWATFSVPLTPAYNYDLVEGVNTVAVEQHVISQWSYMTAFDLRLSLIRKNSSCASSAKKAEICDGVDNDLDGLVDIGPDGKLLTQPCSTPCGTGISTCIDGYFQQCTAVPATDEVCDGKDNNCDGLVDNGLGQLDCKDGFACSAGKCLPLGNATTPRMVWPRNSSGWYYYDKGGNLDAVNPTWRTGNSLVSSWPIGAGPLGFNAYNPSWEWFGTNISMFTKDGKSVTAYFVKNFTLTQADLDNTYGIDFSVRRVDGAVIYLNGVEVTRSNMNWGPVLWNTTAASNAQSTEWSPGCCNLQWTYNKCTNCFHNTSYPLKVGVNVIAAELHLGYRWEQNAAFDMDLYRNNIVPCSSLPGSPSQCVRQVEQAIIPANAEWKYLDGSLALPTDDWILPTYKDTMWKSGVAPIGYGSATWMVKTNMTSGGENGVNEPRRAYYFRKSVDVPDAKCYFQMKSNLLSNDAAVVYMNGLEVYRRGLPPGPVNSTVYSKYGGNWAYEQRVLAGGWLKNGTNLFAVELHKAQTSVTIFFDLQILGSREGITCSPPPL